MQVLYALIDRIVLIVRSAVRKLATVLNQLTGGKLDPNLITITGLLAHIPIAWLIATRHPIWAGGLLIIFGLFDTLDGELARVQKRTSAAGMLLDASTDRMKEVLLYSGAAYFFVVLGYPFYAVWAVAACGSSIIVSYVKAKGEVAVTGSGLSPTEINYLFQGGLARFEVRMFLLIVGLFTSLLPEMLIVITVVSTMTAIGRLVFISRKLG
jgi:CDP-diacylglycerol---glycerol-3-phosphate 3-phosphatidyltransferase